MEKTHKFDRPFNQKTMAPKTEEQYQELREIRKEQIMETALALFAQKSFDRTSMSEIAREAGISKGLSYNYFLSKEDLLHEIIMRGFNKIIELFDPNRDGELSKEEFIFFINENFRMVKEHPTYWKLYYSLVMQPSILEKYYAEMEDVIKKYMKILTSYFTQKGCKDPQTEVAFFSSIMDGVLLNFVLNPEFPADKIKTRIIALFT
ncbi:MAG: TetR/AcrR family transcriptional regulator [Bacteroidales bacterium]